MIRSLSFVAMLLSAATVSAAPPLPDVKEALKIIKSKNYHIFSAKQFKVKPEQLKVELVKPQGAQNGVQLEHSKVGKLLTGWPKDQAIITYKFISPKDKTGQWFEQPIGVRYMRTSCPTVVECQLLDEWYVAEVFQYSVNIRGATSMGNDSQAAYMREALEAYRNAKSQPWADLKNVIRFYPETLEYDAKSLNMSMKERRFTVAMEADLARFESDDFVFKTIEKTTIEMTINVEKDNSGSEKATFNMVKFYPKEKGRPAGDEMYETFETAGYEKLANGTVKRDFPVASSKAFGQFANNVFSDLKSFYEGGDGAHDKLSAYFDPAALSRLSDAKNKAHDLKVELEVNGDIQTKFSKYSALKGNDSDIFFVFGLLHKTRDKKKMVELGYWKTSDPVIQIGKTGSYQERLGLHALLKDGKWVVSKISTSTAPPYLR
ncbi:MAG: hypothetical protein OEZ43_05740 [Gammaproteobacteria bacterium]|nr:hypothetical protein [Gammaproteobacteria bacterium]